MANYGKRCKYGKWDRHDEKVYFITQPGWVKIGRSSQIGQRRMQLQSSNPYNLELLGDIPNRQLTQEETNCWPRNTEKAILRELKDFRTKHTSEWIRLTPEVKKYLNTIIKEQKFIPLDIRKVNNEN